MNTGSVLAQFTITLSKAVNEPVQVEWFTSEGTAKAGVDFAANKGMAVFAAGETEKKVDILVYGRAVGTEDRSFFVEMLPPTNAILGAAIGECIIHVDTSGSVPVTQIIVPTGPQGPTGKSAYQSYLDTTTDNPPKTEAEWVDSLKGDPAEIAQEVAPLIDVGATTLTAEGTEALSKPDTTTVKAVARRVAYAAPAKIATVVLADGDNAVGQSDMTGDTLDMSSEGLYPRIMRGSTVITPQWSIQPDGKITVKGAVAGDVLYVCQYDFVSSRKTNTNTRELWRRTCAEAGLTLVDGSFEEGATAGSKTDAVWSIAGGQCYTWGGALPKDVPAKSTPVTSGGITEDTWEPVTLSLLRKQISFPEGATKYPELQIARWRDEGDIRGWGAVEGEDATSAINAAIADRAALGWGTSSTIIIDGYYKIEGQVLLTTDTRIQGNWATITSSADNWIFDTAYKNSSGIIVNNHENLTDEDAIGLARLKGTKISGITFVGVSKVFHLNCFTERCGLTDIAFENCGIAFDARLSFYPYVKNVIVRGVKVGFEEYPAYQLRHQCNQFRLEKVTIAGRKFGELIDDDITPTGAGIVKNCQNISHIDCTYESVTTGVQAKIMTYGYANTGWYAEQVAGNLFEFTEADHFDVFIGKPSWAWGVENQGHFHNLKGRSEIYQSTQHNYTPAKRSSLRFSSSIADVFLANHLTQYTTHASTDYGIDYDATSFVQLIRSRLTTDNVLVKEDTLNLIAHPVMLSGSIPVVAGKAIGVTGRSYASGTNALIVTTDIWYSEANLILVALKWHSIADPSKSFSSTAMLMNGWVQDVAGQKVTYAKDGDNTVIYIADPAGGGDTSWLLNNGYVLEGMVRLI